MSAINNATDALKLASTTLGDNSNQPTTIQGRHWSFYVTAAGATIGAVCAIAAVILQVYAGIVAGALLFVTNGIGAYYIQKFVTFKQLDDYVVQLADKIKKLATTVTDLRKTNEGFQKTTQEMSADLKKSDESWKTGAAALENKTKQLDETAKKIEDAHKKLQKMEELYLNVQKAIATFSLNVSDLAKTNVSLNADIAKLAKEVQNAFEVASKLDKENKEFDSNNEAYEFLNKKNLEFLKVFENEVIKILTLKGEADKVVKPIQESSTVLSNVSSRIEDSLSKIEQMEKKENDLWQETKSLDNSMDTITKELQKLAKEKQPK